MAEQEGQEKTEAPTERKRQKSRDEGQVAFSRELPSAALLAGCTLILLFTSPFIFDSAMRMMNGSFSEMVLSEELTIPLLYKVFSDALSTFLPSLIPLALTLFSLAILASILQVGMRFTITADRYLHHMVRYLTGTMVDIGSGRRPLEDMARLLVSPHELTTSARAPSTGLFLHRVTYPGDRGSTVDTLPTTERTRSPLPR